MSTNKISTTQEDDYGDHKKIVAAAGTGAIAFCISSNFPFSNYSLPAELC